MKVVKSGNYVHVFTDGNKANKEARLTFSLGNNKLDSSILIFNTLAGKAGSCRQDCKGCYAMNPQKRYPKVAECRTRNLNIVKENPWILEPAIKAIMAKPWSKQIKAVRIHESGEFFSVDYAKAWNYIASLWNLPFYSYTKNRDMIQYLNHVNVVRSVYPEGFNFGSKEYVNTMARKYKGVICPAIRSKATKCGLNCKACQTKTAVFFDQH